MPKQGLYLRLLSTLRYSPCSFFTETVLFEIVRNGNNAYYPLFIWSEPLIEISLILGRKEMEPIINETQVVYSYELGTFVKKEIKSINLTHEALGRLPVLSKKFSAEVCSVGQCIQIQIQIINCADVALEMVLYDINMADHGCYKTYAYKINDQHYHSSASTEAIYMGVMEPQTYYHIVYTLQVLDHVSMGELWTKACIFFRPIYQKGFSWQSIESDWLKLKIL